MQASPYWRHETKEERRARRMHLFERNRKLAYEAQEKLCLDPEHLSYSDGSTPSETSKLKASVIRRVSVRRPLSPRPNAREMPGSPVPGLETRKLAHLAIMIGAMYAIDRFRVNPDCFEVCRRACVKTLAAVKTGR